MHTHTHTHTHTYTHTHTHTHTHTCLCYWGVLGSSCLILIGWGSGKCGQQLEKYITPLHMCEKNPTPLERVQNKINPLELIFYIYPNLIVFHENSLFITFIKNVYQWGMDKNSYFPGSEKYSTPLLDPPPNSSPKFSQPPPTSIKWLLPYCLDMDDWDRRSIH